MFKREFEWMSFFPVPKTKQVENDKSWNYEFLMTVFY